MTCTCRRTVSERRLRAAPADGQNTLTQDCGACHQILAGEDSSPDILKTLGLWDHIDALQKH